MPTTKEIIGDYIDLQVDLMLAEDNEEQLMIEEKISETQTMMKK